MYMVGHILDKKINRILIYEEYEINSLIIYSIKKLGITPKELTKSFLVIEGFN